MQIDPQNQAQEPDGRTTFTVLVTGANAGLGFATCCRLIDEFLATRPQSQTLYLLFSTRDAKKSQDTLKRLNAHLQKTLKQSNARTPGISLLLEGRIKLEGVLVDLTRLLTVKALAKQLLTRRQHLDAVVWNAGIAGWNGMNYLKAAWDVTLNMLEATTYPHFMTSNVGILAKPQLSGYDKIHTFSEPALGQVFLSNVFGHYMLTHWIAPLLTPDTRIVWTTSISGVPEVFDLDDIQGLQARMAYESSKRLTDLLVMTSEMPSTQRQVRTFLPAAKETDQRPRMYITHPGVVKTLIADVHWLIVILQTMALYVARWIGSEWQCISAYKGAIATVFTVLSSDAQLVDMEKREGKGKWGSAVDVFGNERVARSEVEGWGFAAKLEDVPSGSVRVRRAGRKPGTKETREAFEEAGMRVWREMEELRVAWEKRLGEIGVNSADSVDA